MKSDVLRRIAGTELDKLFPDTAPRARDDLITAVVRQWITSAGHAGIFTVARNYWLHFEEFPDERFQVHAEVTTPDGLGQLLRNHLAQEDDVPRILRQLTLRQAVVFDNEDAIAFKIRVRPELRRFEIEPADPEE
ncbi:hypothetical protein FTUN_6059 [Frigoriglobus tundricola]|uniref:Uncharacterized protein n=1 Tax=Frigoriglobus tundricola TaxID=2774151 RepID=A0A6M5YWX5_9BACT|nr:hypothetical protein FTUN_6059 [Frigoriglobus tundricola]